MDLFTEFDSFIEKHNLCTKDSRILLAISGGKDSVLMLHLFVSQGYQVAVAHCNFGLRGSESDADEEFVRQLALAYKLPFYSQRFESRQYAHRQGISIQMACRTLRYEWFEELRAGHGYHHIAVAHHGSDNVETILINLLRGTGLRGWRGIKVARDFIIRPLLFMSVDEVHEAISALKLPFREDSSNSSTDYLRNKLRIDVFPHLKAINPDLEATFAKNGEIVDDVSEFIQEFVENWKSNHLKKIGEAWSIGLDDVLGLKPRRLLLFELLRSFAFSAAVCEDISESIDAGRVGKHFDSVRYRLWLDRTHLRIEPLKGENSETSDFTVSIFRESLPISVSIGTFGRMTFGLSEQSEQQDHTKHAADKSSVQAIIDAKHLVFPLKIRPWREGDVFKPIGMQGKRKKVSDFFISAKIPLWKKSSVPLVENGDGEIIWVCPYRIAETFKVSDNTKNILSLCYISEESEDGT